MQHQRPRPPGFIRNETDLRIDNPGEELGFALAIKKHVTLPGQPRDQLISLTTDRHDGLLRKLIETNIAVEYSGIHVDFPALGFIGVIEVGASRRRSV